MSFSAHAAAYVRMSSDRQDLSIGLQLSAIQSYAANHDLELVHTYEDAAKSGLQISNREGMKALLRDVMDTPRPFDVVLVYDVSRWGRFQDIDAAAYYEYTCRMHGARVIYVQEAFGADQSPMTALLKTMKRAMAAEYARELGVKSRAGQDQAIGRGFQMGPMPCVGLRKVVVERSGNRRPLLHGQGKANQSERIAWEPGSTSEVDLVRRIFQLYAAPHGTIKGVARQLRFDGATTPTGRQFTTTMVDNLLRCEAFAGNFVWGRERYVAGQASKKRPETRADGVIDRIIDPDLWAQVQSKLWARRRLRRDKEQLLQVLRDRLSENPEISTLDLEAIGIHSKKAYTNAFGSVSRALELAGRDPRVIRSLHERRKLTGRQVGDRVERDLRDLLDAAGMRCHIHPRSRLLIIEDRLRVRLQLLWPREHGSKRWHILKKRKPLADLVLLAQMDQGPIVTNFYLMDGAQFRALPPWLSAQGPHPLTSSDHLVAAFRAALVRV